MSERTLCTAAALVAGAGVAVALAVSQADGGERPAPEAPAGLTVVTSQVVGVATPGGAVTGLLEVENPGPRAVRVTDVVLAPPTSDSCERTGVALAPTIPLTPEAPLEVPADGTATLGFTAYMDGEGDAACQGALLTSVVTLDGERAGAVTLTAGTLEPPPAPTGGLTTSTRAAVRWGAATAAAPGWVLERTVAGTSDWVPACGSSAARPLRTPSCTDTGLARSTAYVYRVTLRTGHWTVTSRPGAPVRTQERPSA